MLDFGRFLPLAHAVLLAGFAGGLAFLPNTALAGEYVNHAGLSFVDIPAGVFFMGACRPGAASPGSSLPSPGAYACPSGGEKDAEAYEDETPQHRVAVGAFQLGKTPVTLGQFKRFAHESGRESLLDERFLKANEGQGDMTPVVRVNWQDARDFIDWLNRTRPKTDQGQYRLPSEAEWEYAARGGTRSPFYFGEAAEKRLGLFAWYDKNAGNRQRVVGSRKPNPFGLYDMLGNVWEWTEDCWNENYQNAPADGRAWLQGDCSRRVVRGGSWFDVPLYLRVSTRFGDRATRRINYDGFRVVRFLPPPVR